MEPRKTLAELGLTQPEFYWRQAPPELDFTNMSQVSSWVYAMQDPRMDGLPFMASFWPTLLCTVAYLLLIPLGKRWMANRPAFSLRWAMILYNVIVAALNGWMFVTLAKEMWRTAHPLICSRVDFSDDGMTIAFMVYCYYMSKLLDFTDTAFMILRKKNEQASFLHIYHHAAMFIIWWFVARYAGGGEVLLGPLLNTFVHAVMYSYYLASCFKITIPGKRYLTQLQMTQLFTVLSQTAISLALDCPYAAWGLCLQLSFMLSLLYLFAMFYRSAYKKKAKRVQ